MNSMVRLASASYLPSNKETLSPRGREASLFRVQHGTPTQRLQQYIYIYTCFSLHLQVIFRAVEQISTGLSVCQSLFLTKTHSLQLSACL